MNPLNHTPFAFSLVALVAACTLAAACGSSTKLRGAVCTSNAECSGTGPCIIYECVALSACNVDSDCTAGICNKGYCYGAECNADKPCTPGYICHDKGYCVQDPTGNETSDVQGVDLESGDGQTPDASECQVAADCAGKLTLGVCQQAACSVGKCVAVPQLKDTACTHLDICTSDGKCDADGTCQAGPNTCDCVVDADCQGKGIEDQCTRAVCNGDHKCIKAPDAAKLNQPCNDANGCTSGETCNAQGQCVGGSDSCVTDTQNPCQQGATCVSTGESSFVCAYVKKPCDDGNPCTDASCNVTTGTCDADNAKPFQTTCAIVGAKLPTICGVAGVCQEVVRALIPGVDVFPRFEAACYPGGDAKMYALLTSQTQGGCTEGYAVYELDQEKNTFMSGQKWANSCNITPTCHRDMVFAISNDVGMEAMRYDAGGPKWTLQTGSEIADPQVAQFYLDNAFELRQVRRISRLGASTYFVGRLVQSSDTQLIRCTDKGCDHVDLKLGPPVGQWWTLEMIAATVAKVDTALLLHIDTGVGKGPWRLSTVVDGKFAPSCDGSDPKSACYSPFGWPGEYRSDFAITGMLGLGGFLDGQTAMAYLVGESPWANVIKFSNPFTYPKPCALETQATDCESGICDTDTGLCTGEQTRRFGLLAVQNGGEWVRVTSKPTASEPEGDASLIDFVFARVTVVQGGRAVVIAGFYRACFGNCIAPPTTKEYIRMQTQAFLVTYYPDTDTWSQMMLLGTPVAKRCCYGSECTASAPTTTDPNAPWTPEICSTMVKNNGGFLNPYIAALEFRRADGTMYLMANPEQSVSCQTGADCVGFGLGRCVGVVPGTFASGWCAASGLRQAEYFFTKAP